MHRTLLPDAHRRRVFTPQQGLVRLQHLGDSGFDVTSELFRARSVVVVVVVGLRVDQLQPHTHPFAALG
ncbi:MAG: hypothetical protein MUF16_07570 [Burkholderiaceae bacterium]|nr:hypothetical protein [Burkholderiaceae bacterium]